MAWWTPKYIIRKELKNISHQTTTALKTLVTKDTINDFNDQNQQPAKNINELRRIMAQTQSNMVKALENANGREETIRLGRKALFSVGQELGKQTRIKLGIGNSPRDLTKAAKILYRILGIEFHLEWVDKSNVKVIIYRCALAEQYSKLTCEVLSATDEGVIEGLQPNVTMKFGEFMTNGCKNCKADIHFSGEVPGT